MEPISAQRFATGKSACLAFLRSKNNFDGITAALPAVQLIVAVRDASFEDTGAPFTLTEFPLLPFLWHWVQPKLPKDLVGSTLTCKATACACVLISFLLPSLHQLPAAQTLEL